MARTVQNAEKSTSGHATRICKAKDARTRQHKVPSRITRRVPQSMYKPLVTPSNLQGHWSTNKGFMRVAGGASDPVFPEGVYVEGVCERALNSQVCAEPVIVLHFVCSGLSPLGSPAKLLEVVLEEYHADGTLQCEQIVFDFGTQKKFVRWSATANKLAKSLISSPFTRKVLFISTHSDIERGDLFAGQGDDGTDQAMEVTTFMTHLFTGGLEDVVFNATLFLLTCGPMVWITESFMAMKDAVKFLKPEFVVAFDASNFISTVLKTFLLNYFPPGSFT
ncbi:hypothetical protein EDD15DRAFT_2376780 [Pisolithus albus]|nr:hypothetical protein EDD15DRAFT_2376780 [Pisolithus albus]